MREIETLGALDTALSRHTPLRGLRLQDLDLRRREAALLRHTDLEGLVVLGGQVTPALEAHLRAHGAMLFPTDPHAPVNPYRALLYSPHELYAGLAGDGYAATPDARAYAWYQDARVRSDVFVTMLRAVHDDSMGDALDELLDGLPVAGVMGGHTVQRGGADYAAAVRLGHALASAGLVVATGGGPGAMEAANLGAFCRDAGVLEQAQRRLAAVPDFAADVAAWARTGLTVRDEVAPADGAPVRSVGLPTWFYGHEPPNVFCDGVAKFFSNALREDGLLARCTAGLVILPGTAGTVQEVFQAATRLYYTRVGTPPPMVLVGREHWTHGIPVWPALQALGEQRTMGSVVHLVDDPDEAVAILAAPWS
ncbi:Rossmann fold nucleotide-binding protein [Oryzihumus sp.]|uniref:LOG family protein n=1 Tax=Oryzihumus sp. TaxID=1968903 RepID=UPI002ED93720